MPTTANGFVVVSRWLPARTVHASYAYEAFESLPEATTYYRRLAAGKVRDFAAHGMFAVHDGLPPTGAMDAEAIAQVLPAVPPRVYGIREYEPNSPENLRLREQRRLEPA